MSALRKVQPMAMPDVTPAAEPGGLPELGAADPASLLVDETYQRNLSERSVSLIRRIVAEWSWAAFKPPIVVRVDGGLHVIDGQHTAIAAATHPGIAEIPVLIVDAPDASARAAAFVRHNRDRVNITKPQVHYAMLAAGDEDALTIAQACERAGARVLRSPPSHGLYEPGDCMAVTTLYTLLNRRYAAGLRRVLQICAEAELAPISALLLKAVEAVLFDAALSGSFTDEDVTAVLLKDAEGVERAARVFAAKHSVLINQAAGIVLAQRLRKGGGAS